MFDVNELFMSNLSKSMVQVLFYKLKCFFFVVKCNESGSDLLHLDLHLKTPKFKIPVALFLVPPFLGLKKLTVVGAIGKLLEGYHAKSNNKTFCSVF